MIFTQWSFFLKAHARRTILSEVHHIFGSGAPFKKETGFGFQHQLDLFRPIFWGVFGIATPPAHGGKPSCRAPQGPVLKEGQHPFELRSPRIPTESPPNSEIGSPPNPGDTSFYKLYSTCGTRLHSQSRQPHRTSSQLAFFSTCSL